MWNFESHTCMKRIVAMSTMYSTAKSYSEKHKVYLGTDVCM